ncbi:MAG: NADH-quinone oxidoreductase subunit C, partial [Candidatus Thermoplasmatota archaeon]|nr:NADH-quinone oxidoreductase subunit C [Candidatus Thermoplasmatota archaeon]
TISHIVPGAVITEREKQEFLGITIDGIPDPRRLFLTENLPEGLYPWRKDETGVEHLVRNVHEPAGKKKGGE